MEDFVASPEYGVDDPNDAALDTPFAVVKFPPKDLSSDEELFDVGLSGWIVGGPQNLDENMGGFIYWPPEGKNVTHLIKTQQPHDPSWRVYEVVVLRFYATYVRARQAVPKFIADSNYETEADNSCTGRGKRQRFKPAFLESSDEDIPVKKPRQAVKPPPPILSVQAKQAPTVKVRKGQGLVEDAKKKSREELMARLKNARAIAAAKLASQSPAKSPQKNKWKVTPIKPLEVESQLTPKKSTLKSAVASPKAGPSSAKEISSPVDSAIDFGNYLDVHINEGSDNDLNFSDSETPFKSTSPSTRVGNNVLSRSKSFYLSPKDPETLAAATSSIISRHESTASSPHKPIQKSSDKLTSTVGVSKLDGRRNLFPKGKTEEERMVVLQMSVSRLNIDVNELSQKVDMVLMNLSRLQRSLVPNEKRLTVPPNMPKLPLESRQKLNQFETFLGESDLNLAAVCDYMSSYVRTSVLEPEKKSANHILGKLLTNDLAKEINLEGGNKKIAFRSLNLYKVFQGTLQAAFPDSDLMVAEGALKNWLKDAKWRKQRALPDGA